tara:strand:- start:1061 stop:1639 length:579 start_codon:yes stop_codon:yes gene_type:complete
MMNKSSLSILNFKALYNIFFETKDFHNFNLHEYQNEKDLIEGLKKQENSVIISRAQINNRSINSKQIIIIEDYPLNFFSLIDKINSIVLMQQYDFQSNYEIKNYKVNLNSKIISNKDKELKLTQREIEVILYLKKSDQPVNVNALQKKVWGYSENLETHTVETHIYRLRKKLKKTFDDENFIESLKEGYIIK